MERQALPGSHASLTLVILAAGAGRRFGGAKQVEGFGPAGEWLVEYTIHEAREAGIRRVVLVVRPDLEAVFRTRLDGRVAGDVDLRYAPQDEPRGTGQAVLAAQDLLDGPFAVANADDVYGVGSFRVLASSLVRLPADHALLVAFRLENTLSPHGPVSRALCCTDGAGALVSLEELSEVRGGEGLVSMNLWGFHPSVLETLAARYVAHGEGEFQLPTEVAAAVRDGALVVRVLESDERWLGVTWPDDRTWVRARLAARESPASIDLAPVLDAYGLSPRGANVEPWGSGHIHDTYRVTSPGAVGERRVLLQRLNARVFPDPRRMTASIGRVTDHLRSRLPPGADAPRLVLSLLLTRDGSFCHRDAAGDWWRAYPFIDGARSHDVVVSPTMARRAAHAFGAFQRDLADLPPPRLPETLPGFHDTPARFAAFRRAVEADAAGRGCEARPEIETALAHERLTHVLLDAWRAGDVPERVTHNDTKINNVLFDDVTGEALCVIDLDTVMPGLGLYDVGDMIRTTSCRTAEDERDLRKVRAEPDLVEAIVGGYVEAMGPLLTAGERALLLASGEVITLEIGLRFLTDFLEGDVYFKTYHPHQNLDRCRAQFALLASLERQRDRMAETMGRESFFGGA